MTKTAFITGLGESSRENQKKSPDRPEASIERRSHLHLYPQSLIQKEGQLYSYHLHHPCHLFHPPSRLPQRKVNLDHNLEVRQMERVALSLSLPPPLSPLPPSPHLRSWNGHSVTPIHAHRQAPLLNRRQ